MPDHEERAIFRLLAYFAFFQFPLTVLEIQKWLTGEERSCSELEEKLRVSRWLQDHGVQGRGGFWGIGDVAAWRRERCDRMTDALRKARKMTRIARWMALVPWIRWIALGNSSAFAFTTSVSDIDLFIVTNRRRIWSTRLVLAGLAALLRVRPGEGKSDPLCLSFFVTEDALDFAQVTIGAEDPYLRMWIATLMPIMERDGVGRKFWAANRWIKTDLPNVTENERAALWSIPPRFSLPDVGVFEGLAERFQRRHFPKQLRLMMNNDTRVVVTDSMLKFHHNDRREEILQAWQTVCRSAGV